MTRTPEQARGYIADRSEAQRMIQALTEAADRDPRQVVDQLAAIRNCPDAMAELGRVLAHGEKERGSTGPSRDQSIENHMDRAVAHVHNAMARFDDIDKATGQHEDMHGAARLSLARQLAYDTSRGNR